MWDRIPICQHQGMMILYARDHSFFQFERMLKEFSRNKEIHSGIVLPL